MLLQPLTRIALLVLLPQTSLPPAAPGPSLPPTTATQAPPPIQGPRVLLEKVDGTVEVRALDGFDTPDPRSLGARCLRFEGVPALPPSNPSEASAVLELSTGDFLNGRIRAGRAELLDIELSGGVHVGVSVDELKSLVFPRRVPEVWTAPLTAPASGDRLYRRQGAGLDTIGGGVEEFTTDGLRFRGDQNGEKLYTWTEVAALFIDVLEKREVVPLRKGLVPVVVDLVDQSRVRGALERISVEGCRLSTHNGEKLLLPPAVISGIFIDDGALVFLSSIAASQAIDSAPFGDDLGMHWRHRVDRSVTGSPLSAGGRIFTRGIGVHAPSRLTWKLDGPWKELRGLVAIDDQVVRLSSKGSAIFRIHLDGEKRWESPVVHGGDAPIAIPPLSLAAVRELTLEVDVATDSYVADRADWLQMMLVR